MFSKIASFFKRSRSDAMGDAKSDVIETDFSHPEFKRLHVDAIPYSHLELHDNETAVDIAINKAALMAVNESCEAEADRQAILKHTLAVLEDLSAPEAAKEAIKQFSREIFVQQCQRLDNITTRLINISAESHLQPAVAPPPSPDDVAVKTEVTDDDVDESGISDEDWEAYVKQICGDDY